MVGAGLSCDASLTVVLAVCNRMVAQEFTHIFEDVVGVFLALVVDWSLTADPVFVGGELECKLV